MTDGAVSKMRFTWNISYDCNYRCSYCFFDGKWDDYRKRNIYLSVDDWMKHWDMVREKYGEIFLVITGGEPLIYPNFIELTKRLSKICSHINVSTNSSMNLLKFVKEIDPEKVSISLSFQREFDSLEVFMERVRLIRKYNFKGCLNLVAYPPFLEKLESDKKKLMAETQEEFKIVPFFGRYKNLEYPQGYTQAERQLIGIDDKWFNKVRRKGSLCSAGHTSALIFPDGKVARCGQVGERFILGDFFDAGLKLHDQPMVCDAEYCPCQEDNIEGDGQGQEESRVVGITKEADTRDLSRPKIKTRFAWDIHYKCNFRCPYCWFYKDWARLGVRNLYLSPDEWMEHWKRIYDSCGETKIEIVGGEPFIYPGFIELVKKLSRLHSIKVTTNLSGDIEQFAKEIDPERVELDLNFHVLFIDLESVIKKTLILKQAGFKAGICYLAYPPQMHKIKSLSERFREEGIGFAIAAFWGEHGGKKYPEAYTEEERRMLRPFIGDIDRISYHLNAKSPKGKLCNAGYTYADIQADGNVVRCAPLGNKSIGNITDKNFRLLDKPYSCDSNSCPCNEYDNLVCL